MIKKNLSTLSDVSKRWFGNGHRSGVIWFTGLSGSGKTTLATSLERDLFDKGCQVVVLDGDNFRHSLSKDLGFSVKDREENIRRVSAVCSILSTKGMIVLTAFISPYQSDRELARKVIGRGFKEVFLDPGLEVCERRDPKGLYKKARTGEIRGFTGISAPHEPPQSPDLKINTANKTIAQCSEELLRVSCKFFELT